jgi:hypothetical protein
MLFHSRLAQAAPAPAGARNLRDIQDPVPAAPGGRRIGDPVRTCQDAEANYRRRFPEGFPGWTNSQKTMPLGKGNLAAAGLHIGPLAAFPVENGPGLARAANLPDAAAFRAVSRG